MSKSSEKFASTSDASTTQEYSDGRSYDVKAVRQITQDWIDYHMIERENEYLKSANCSIFCGTWNVNAKKLEGGLQDWILPSGLQPADLYVIGFQEIVDLNAVNVALNSNNTQSRAQFWDASITTCLDSTGVKYHKIKEKFLVGLLIGVYVKDSLLPNIKDIRSTSLGVGLMGMMGNKGGVCIRLSVYDSTVCFVCSHLAAHRENVAGRNSDFKNIYEKASFSTENQSSKEENTSHLDGDVIDSVVMPSQGAERYIDKQLSVSSHDLIFWIGDLNYRIDDSLTTEDVFAKIEGGDLESLRAKDQLNIERSRGRVFQGFQEGTLSFLPTYKYQPGTDNYETRAEKKLRAPAWCDRILWKVSSPKEAVKLVDYRRSNLLPSDHKPVSALFNCTLRQVVSAKEKIVFKNLQDILSKHASKAAPQVEITGLKIKAVEKMVFDRKGEWQIVISNTGESVAHWRFVPKLEEVNICKKWMSFDKVRGLLLPGESCVVTLTAIVDVKTAQLLNAGKDLLQDIVILRVEKSIDYYVEFVADYQRSCFGVALEELVHITEPIAKTPLPAENPEYYLKETTADSKPKMSIPKELWRLVDCLWSGNSLKEKNLFNSIADQAEVQAVRQALNFGSDFPSCSPHAVVDCLLGLLSALPKPLLPTELLPIEPIDNANARIFCRKLLEDLPALNYNVFVYLISFFREVLLEDSYNRCSPQQLATVCVHCMTAEGVQPQLEIQAPEVTPSASSSIPPSQAVAKSSDVLSSNDFSSKNKKGLRRVYLVDAIVFLLTTPNL